MKKIIVVIVGVLVVLFIFLMLSFGMFNNMNSGNEEETENRLDISQE